MSALTAPSWELLRRLGDPPNDLVEPQKDALAAFYCAMGAYINNGCYGLWLEPDSEDGHCDPEKLAVTIGSRFSNFWLLCDGFQGSPIEAKLAAALLWISVDWAGKPSVNHEFNESAARAANSKQVDFFLTPQATILKYKVDLLLWFSVGREIGGVAIECDGHAFHEKTKEQAARDKRRDREILLEGFPVVRFSGSEIYNDAIGCAAQVSELLSPILYRVTKDAGLIG